MSEADKWQCYMCLADENKQVGLMKRRENWDKELHELFMNDNEIEFVRYDRYTNGTSLLWTHPPLGQFKVSLLEN